MADMCAERRMYWTYRLQDDGDKGYSKDYKFGKNCFWRKWCVRWLALADKFKEDFCEKFKDIELEIDK